MPRKRLGRPTWFRLQLTVQPIIEAYPDEDVGRALKLAMRYFKDGAMPCEDESLMAVALFSILKAEIDDRFREHENAIVNGGKAQHFETDTIENKSTTSKRKNVPNRKRFEVFERDKFTCQYCGRSAPNVILEIDHVVPVSRGGNNDIANLVTSCKECNGGKASRKLSIR